MSLQDLAEVLSAGFQHDFILNKDTSTNCFSVRNISIMFVRPKVDLEITPSWFLPVNAVLLTSWAGIYI